MTAQDTKGSKALLICPEAWYAWSTFVPAMAWIMQSKLLLAPNYLHTLVLVPAEGHLTLKLENLPIYTQVEFLLPI